jgi:hypothetical protein
MKNLFLVFLFTFISLNTFAQKQFEGMWVSEESTHINTILADNNKIIKVFNFSFHEDDVIEETILSQNKNEFVTELYNKENGYRVTIHYKLNKKSNLVCKFSGHYKGKIISKKLTIKK